MIQPSSRSLIGLTVVFPITDEDADRSIDYGLKNISKQLIKKSNANILDEIESLHNLSGWCIREWTHEK